MQRIKIVVERHPDGYVAYPLGLKGVVVGEGDTSDAALADVRSAIEFHVETFGLGDGPSPDDYPWGTSYPRQTFQVVSEQISR